MTTETLQAQGEPSDITQKASALADKLWEHIKKHGGADCNTEAFWEKVTADIQSAINEAATLGGTKCHLCGRTLQGEAP